LEYNFPLDGKVCEAEVNAADFDYGSTDPNGDHLIFEASPPGPYEVGVHQVTVTVSDGNGNCDMCEATVTVTAPPCHKNGEAMDDPHFKTWAGKWYDYMGACDLVLISAPNFETGLSLDIFIRTKIRYQYSYIESAVVKIGDETLEVASFGLYFLNGISHADMPNEISGFPIVYKNPTEKVHVFEIQLDENEKIVLKTFKDMVSVKLDEADAKRFHGSYGMLGDYETGKMVARDGITVIEDPNAFAAEWQVREDLDGPMLFQTSHGPQYPQACMVPDANKKDSRHLRLGGVSREAAEKACANWADNKEACVSDVMATGDVDLAAAGAF
jgi:hypothetical protein